MAEEEKDVEKKEKKKSRKARKEEKKRKGGENPEEEEEEKLGSKIILVVITLLIIIIWLAIIALLIKMDVGGFGSSVLYPVLKDVPYVNKILPDVESEGIEDTQYQYDSLDEAVERIKELEAALSDSTAQNAEDEQTIADLEAQVEDLSTYKDEQAEFELEKEKFYEEVVFSDEAPDIEEYKTYYESIDPENAEVLYKQVVEQIAYSQELEDYVSTYSSMKAKDAAAIFDTMTDNLELVSEILEAMDTQSRADILAEMDAETAALVTEILEPDE